MSSSNINSKINIKNINNNSKENYIRVIEATTAPITNKNRIVKTKTASVTTITIADSMVKMIDVYLLTSSISQRYIV